MISGQGFQESSFSEYDVPERDLVLWAVDNLSESGSVSYTRLQKTIFLLLRTVLEKNNLNSKYQFNETMSHTGPFDRELQDDIETWQITGCVSNTPQQYPSSSNSYVPTHNLKTTPTGHRYASKHARENLEKTLGKDIYRKLEYQLRQYNSKTERDLIGESLTLINK